MGVVVPFWSFGGGVIFEMYGKRGPFSTTETFLFPQTPEETPLSRRFGLRKTGSSSALGPADRLGAEGASGAGLQRSASSSRVEGTSAQVSGVRGQGTRPC